MPKPDPILLDAASAALTKLRKAREEVTWAEEETRLAQRRVLYQSMGLYVGCIVEVKDFHKGRPFLQVWQVTKIDDVFKSWRFEEEDGDYFTASIKEGKLPCSLSGRKATRTGFHKNEMYLSVSGGWKVLRDDPRAGPVPHGLVWPEPRSK